MPLVNCRLAAVGALLLALSVNAVAAEDAKRAFEIADNYRTNNLGSPTVSPDGERVAFAVTRYELEAGESWSEIWMIGADGTGLRQMTSGRHHDGSPVFSPDAKNLLFVSDRDGSSQLFLLPVDGGEARRLTDFPMGASAPVWSPDGRWIAVESEVYPECGGDAACNKKISDAAEGGPLKARMADDLLYRHWTSWRDGKYTHTLLVDASSGEIVRDLTLGEWDSPTFSAAGSGIAFPPDGSEVCFVSNRDRDQAQSTNADLWLIPIKGGDPVNITAANDGWDAHPVYSPNGRFIAFLSQAAPGWESDLYRIGLFDRKTKAIRYVTDATNFDNWINDLQWSADSSALFFSGHEKGLTPIFRVDVKSSEITKIVADGSLVGWQVGGGDGLIHYVRTKVGEPSELWSVPDTGGDSVRLTHFNDALAAEVDIRPAEVIWVDDGKGREIQVFVVKPHDFDPAKKYPLILNVHGGPNSPWKDRYRGDWQVYPGKGYVVAFPNPTGSAGFGQDYVDAISCDWGGQIFADLMKVTDALEELPYVDEDRIGTMGWSYGGYMMMWFAGHTDRYKTIVSMMGVYDLRSMWGATEELWFVEHDLCGKPWNSDHYEKWSPSASAGSFKTPTLVITGEKDYRVPYTQSLHFFTDLQTQEVPSRLVVYPNAGHWPSWYEMAFYYLVHLDWFHTWLGGEAPPWDPVKFLRNEVFVEGGAEAAESQQ